MVHKNLTNFLIIQICLQQPFFMCLLQPGTQQTRQTDKASQYLLTHGCRLPGKLDEHIEKKTAAVKNICAQITLDIIRPQSLPEGKKRQRSQCNSEFWPKSSLSARSKP